MYLMCGVCAAAYLPSDLPTAAAQESEPLEALQLMSAGLAPAAASDDAPPLSQPLPTFSNRPRVFSAPGCSDSAGAGQDSTVPTVTLPFDTFVRTTVALSSNDRLGDSASAGSMPSGHKICNLCRRILDISNFPVAGDRHKPYCSTCMPAVRKGSLMGIRVATLREALLNGGPEALSDLLCM